MVCSIIYAVLPMYISEMAPKELRGRLVSLFGIFVTAGVLVQWRLWHDVLLLYCHFHALLVPRLSLHCMHPDCVNYLENRLISRLRFQTHFQTTFYP